MKLEFELFIKYFLGDASPEEAERVETYAQSSPQGYAYVQSLFNSWLETGDAHFEKPDFEKEWELFSANYLRQPIKRRFKIAPIAAALAILLGIAAYFVFFNSKPLSEMITIVAQQEQVILLNDSSRITLSSGSTLEYPNTFNSTTREIKLRGDANFEVYHDSKWPFIIHLQNKLNIIVTGTIFSVKENGEHVTVTLEKGSVLFYNQNDTMPLLAGQSGQFLLHENKFHLLPQKLKTGSFQFNDIPLAELAVQLEQYFHVPIDFKNPNIRRCHFSAGMDDKNLEQIIQIIAVTFNLDYHFENDSVILDGTGCD